MGLGDFFDRAGKAFNKYDGYDFAQEHIMPSLGAAWAAANDPSTGPAKALTNVDNFLGKWTGANKVADATVGATGHVSDAIGTAFSYAVSRNLSTVLQMGQSADPLSPSAWLEAYNRSENISPGQALVTNLVTGNPGQGDKFGSPDPFSDEAAPEREKFFRHTWPGRISSGATDLLLNFAADPTVAVSKVAKSAEIAATSVKAADRAAVLGKATDKTVAATTRQGKQADKLNVLVDTVMSKRVGEIQAMPEFKNTRDAGALANLFDKAKRDNPTDLKAQRQAIVDIIGTSWGDQGSIDRLIAQHADLANELEKLSNPPAGAVSSEVFKWDDNGQGALDLFSTQADRQVTAQREAIDRQLDNMQKIIRKAGQNGPNRLRGTALESLTEARQLSNVNESWIHSGVGSSPIRILSGALNTRIPNHINIKDANAGYTDMTNVLALMRHTSAGDKQALIDKFVKAGTQNGRMNVVDLMNRTMVRDIAAHHGIGEDAVKTIIAGGEGRMTMYRNALKTRLYSAADSDTFIHLHDPEDDIINVFHKPLMQSQLEEMHPSLDPRELDKAMKIATHGRILDNLGPVGTGVANAVGGAVDMAATWLQTITKVWKDSALARLAYPLRIQTDDQLRSMTHLGMMDYMASRKAVVKGQVKYLLTDRETGERSLRNFFKEGDYFSSLVDMLERDVGDGRFNLTSDDIHNVAREMFADNNSSYADLGEAISNRMLRKERTGDWAPVQPNDPEWLNHYIRAVNHQIGNSPAARALLVGTRREVAQQVKSQLTSAQGGLLAREYREVGGGHGSVENWLSALDVTNNHYLPTLELRQMMTGKLGQNTGKLYPDAVRPMFAGATPKVKPMAVHGEAMANVNIGKTKARYERARNGWYRFAADAPSAILARSPIFWHSYRNNIQQALENLTEEHIDLIGADTIRKNAMRAARKEVGEVLYNSADASNLAFTMRHLSPFFSAWEDTMTKWTKLIYDKPQLLPRIQQIVQSPNDAGIVVDSEGNRVDGRGRVFMADGSPAPAGYTGHDQYVMLPKKLTKHVPFLGDVQGGGQLKIRKDSINSVFQGDPFWLPGFGPMVQVPVNKLVRDHFPEHYNDPIMRYVLPYGTTADSVGDQFLPKWAKSARAAFGNSQDYANQYVAFLAEAQIDNNHGGPPVDIEKVKRKTRNYFIMKAFVDNASPVSIAPNAKYQLYIDKAHEYQADKSRKDWAADFTHDFPGYFEASISLSHNNTGIAATAEAYTHGIKKYRKDISKNPELGWMFVGPANAAAAHSDGVYDFEQANEAGRGKSFRDKRDPLDALEASQAEQGWIQWNALRTQVNVELERRGLVSTAQKGAEDLQEIVHNARDILTETNPSWAKAQSNSAGGNKPQQLLDAANAFMKDHPEVRTRPDMVALSQYMELRQQVRDELAARPNKSLAYNPDLKSIMDYGTSKLSANNVGFEQMFNRVLEYDNLAQDVN